MAKPSRFRIRIPIAMKLVGMATCLLIAASSWIAAQVSQTLEVEATTAARSENLFQAKARANEVQAQLANYIEKTRMMASVLLLKKNSTDEERRAAMELMFFQDKDLVALTVMPSAAVQAASGENMIRLSKGDYLSTFGIKPEGVETYIETVRATKPFPFASVFAGSVEVHNSSLPDGAPMISIGFPFVADEFGRWTYIVLVDVRLDRLQASFSELGVRTQYLIDEEGKVLAHPIDRYTLKATDLSKSEIVSKVMSSQARTGEVPFTDDGELYFGAYAKTDYRVSVVSQVQKKTVLLPAQQARNQALHVTGLAVSAALFFVFLFSITLTTPVERLLELTREIAQGNFNVNASHFVRSHDEVGELAQAFDVMTDGLKERDKVKQMFSKFHGSSVADDILKSGEASLSGTSRQVTVFFSDIRDFTKFSEGHTAEEVVTMLNEYFEIMVAIINRSGGVVDKFIGDAIMAVWGAPASTGNDNERAVAACLEMRQALAQLNASRQGRGKTPIRIGMGLHCGTAISGTIGSTERMEYTVIGDTVNMAARIEAATKSFGTDFLVSESIADDLKTKFILTVAGSAEVKGKAEPLKLFKVSGTYGASGEPIIIKTPYSDFEATSDDKVKVS